MAELAVRLVGTHLPGLRFKEFEHVHVGLERGKECVNEVPADAPTVVFDFTVTFVDDDFRGVHVTGKRGDRFVRLVWGDRGDAEWRSFGRTKIHLSGQEALASEAVASQRLLEATMDLTAKVGEPKFASYKPGQIAWRVTDRTDSAAT